MGITQQSAAARLIQPGVCTSSTRPAAPFEGQAIFETDTDRMLIWNGTTWVMPNRNTTNPDGLEFIKTESFSNVSNFEVTGFSTDYDWYNINFNGIKTTSGSSAVLGVLYNGATARNSAYYGGNGYTQFDGTQGNQYTMNNAGDFYATTIENRYRGNFTMRVYFKAGEQFTYNYQAFESVNFRSITGAGFRNATDVWDRIRFSSTTSTITGSYSLYGYRK